MANLLDRFKKDSIGSRGKISDYTAKISSRGDFHKVTDFNVVLNSWRNILLTPLRTYTYDPEYGSELYKLVFEPADNDTIEKIKDEIYERVQYYDDRARIESIDVEFLSNLKGFNVLIIASYRGEKQNMALIIDEKTYFSFLEGE